MKNFTTKEIVTSSIFAAIVILMAVVPNFGFLQIPFFPISITIIFIPVLIGTALYGKRMALILGLVFGISSMIVAFVRPVSPFDLAFQNPFISVMPRVVLTFLFYYLVQVFKKFKPMAIVSLLALLAIVALIIEFTTDIKSLASAIVIGLMAGGVYLFDTKYKGKNLVYVLPSFTAVVVHGILVLNMLFLFNSKLFVDGVAATIITIIFTNTLIEAILTSAVVQLVVPRIKKVVDK